MPIDLRSDFVSRPTEAMVEAMVAAAKERPGFGVRDDPVVSRLERLAAQILDKEDALFCPTCTMANQIAIHIHCRPGEVFLTETTAHVITSEAAAAAALSGVMPRFVASVAGHLAVAELERDFIRERTRAGMAAAKRRGKHVGRPKARVDRFELLKGVEAGESIAALARRLDTSRTVIRRELAEAGLSERVSLDRSENRTTPRVHG